MEYKIKLTKNKYALVDKAFFDKINQYNWQFGENGYQDWGYAIRQDNRRTIRMHQQIMGRVPKGYFIDHINGDKLDNRLKNLRIVNSSVNNINRKRFKNNKTGFKGVYYDAKKNQYSASICINKKKMNLGTYKNIGEAIRIRQWAENKYLKPYLMKEHIKTLWLNLYYKKVRPIMII